MPRTAITKPQSRPAPTTPGPSTTWECSISTSADYAAAAEQFQKKPSNANPDYALAQNNLGITLMASGRYAAARERFQKAIALDPDFAQPHANLGYVLGRLGQGAAAVDELREYLRRQPDNAKALTWLAWEIATARNSVRNGREALELARKAAAAGPRARSESARRACRRVRGDGLLAGRCANGSGGDSAGQGLRPAQSGR